MKRLNITGGEPLLRHDIMDIVRILDTKTKRLEISTNGYFYDRIEEIARRFPKLTVRVSVGGLPATNDQLRGIKDGSEAPWIMGDLKTQSFEEIWNSEQATHIRNLVATCERACWMTGTAVPAMRRAPMRPLLWVMISHMWKAAHDARREHFDVVHIHSTDPCILAWLPNPRYAVVATSHGQAYLRKKWSPAAKAMSKLAERFFIRIPKAVTCVSKPLCEYYRSKYGREVAYIPNGITFREAPDGRFLTKWNLEHRGYLFSSAGRIERTKGLTTPIEAYRRIGTDLPLVIAGGGSATDTPYFDELKAHKPDKVTFTGFLTGDEYYALHAHARVFIFPSEYEAMSMTLLEGLSFGVPAVFSDTPENEAVASGLGFSFHVSDEDSLAERVRYVLEHEADTEAIAKRARETVRRNHDWSAIARQYDEIYLKVASH